MNALVLSSVLLFAVNAAAAPVAVLRSSGPLEISFKVANPRKSAADRLLFAISLRNVGTTDFLLTDRVFSQPSKIAANSVTCAGIFLELHDRSGRVRDVEAADAPWIRGPNAYAKTAPAPEAPREPLFLKPGEDSVPYVPDHCKAGSADRSRGGSQTARPRGAATGSKSARPDRRREESAVSCVRGVSKAVGIQEHVVRRLVVVPTTRLPPQAPG